MSLLDYSFYSNQQVFLPDTLFSEEESDSSHSTRSFQTKTPKKHINKEVDSDNDSLTEYPKKKKSLYKTELCRNWEETGHCRYGTKCQYAHGSHDLRVIERHPKYKTQKCRTFEKTGACPYGGRCNFSHFNLPETDDMSFAESLLPHQLLFDLDPLDEYPFDQKLLCKSLFRPWLF